MKLTQQNASEYLGKTLDANRRLFRHWPLRVGQWTDGTYYVADRNGVCTRIPDENDKSNAIRFDTVKQ